MGAPSRRTILTGSIALTSALAFPLPADGEPSSAFVYAPAATWDALFAEWKRVDVAYNASDDDALGDVEAEIWGRLIRMPAPNRPALLWKMNYLWGSSTPHGEFADAWKKDIVEAVMNDAHRLLA